MSIVHVVANDRISRIDPYTCLVDAPRRVSLHPAREVEEFTPGRWKEKFTANPMKSGLHGLGKLRRGSNAYLAMTEKHEKAERAGIMREHNSNGAGGGLSGGGAD
ncbi:MAG: hypothetical protein U9R74_19615 [Pseudomonadota bacterium]|nr:hypothetical protein [Pseudomonadota bacterium]